ncbi:MAG TPA: PDZ domain-containing protein [Gemmataceae bacterium]
MRHLLLTAGLALLLAAPPARAADEKPEAAGPPKRYEVPYRLTDTQHVLVRVKINGKGPFNFIIDTGAPAVILNEEIGKQLGVQTDRDGWTTFERFELEGGLAVPKARGLVLDMFQLKGMNGLGLAGVKLHGVVGYNLLARYKIEYDFTSDKLVWTELDFDPPPIARIGRGGSQGGLELVGSLMKWMAPLLGIKPNFERAPRGHLGVEVVRNDEGHVVVKSVRPGSPAEKAGVKAGDRIVAAQRKDVYSPRDLMRAAEKLTEGQELRLLLRRGGEDKVLTVELGRGL